MTRLKSRTLFFLSMFAVAFFLAAPAARSRTGNAPEGVPNFAQVTGTLYRGAQPTTVGFKALQVMGMGIVVNFRNEPREISTEKSEVESLGMKYVGIPWSGREKPSNVQVVQFLDLIRANPQVKIFVHCQRGADRTGTMIAAYRIAVQHEPVKDAVSEMHAFHYDHFWLPHLERYVVSLPDLLQNNDLFHAYNLSSDPVADAATTAGAMATLPHQN